MPDIFARTAEPHSLFAMHKYDVPFYSWVHQRDPSKRTRLEFGTKDPWFVRMANHEVVYGDGSTFSVLVQMV